MKINVWIKFFILFNINYYEIIYYIYDIKYSLLVLLYMYYWVEILNRVLI